jgi:predicted CoA-substrate-specific enzyme activase
MIIPTYYNVMGAIGASLISMESAGQEDLTLSVLLERADSASKKRLRPSTGIRLQRPAHQIGHASSITGPVQGSQRPYVMGLDIGSVSAKGVIMDGSGQIIRTHYRLTEGAPLEALSQTMEALTHDSIEPDLVSVTGSARYLAGGLLNADEIVNEISAQTRAAIEIDPEVDCIVEIGGQDSKWISIEQGALSDFVMNRVCAAGTGSFLMEQAARLGMEMGPQFSEEAFSSDSPADLGARCTVFMESDLVSHQNNGANRSDLAAGVCLSIVQNYLDRVAGGKDISGKIMFLGGVAANDAVRAAFEGRLGARFHSPWFYNVSAAYGAALKALDTAASYPATPRPIESLQFDPSNLKLESFICSGCNNQCMVDKYHMRGQRVLFHGGLCDRWEKDRSRSPLPSPEHDPFLFRAQLMGEQIEEGPDPGSQRTWGMVRSPVFYEWFPFWVGFLKELGISLKIPDPFHRRQYDSGLHRLKLETCMPMKALAGQLEELIASGVTTIFHPNVISESLEGLNLRPVEQCPYTQASSEFLKGPSQLRWVGPTICHEPHERDAFMEDHLQWAQEFGFDRKTALRAYQRGLESLRDFEKQMELERERLAGSLESIDPLLVVMGKTYHINEPFFNMNLSSIFRRLGSEAIPADMLTIKSLPSRSPIPWKNQLRMIAEARLIGESPNMFPILISFFGCGPDPFTIRHIQSAIRGKPALILEMDEHSSKAGVMTRIEAFIDRVSQWKSISGKARSQSSPEGKRGKSRVNSMGLDTVYTPYFGEHSHVLAATARSMGINAEVLPEPDEESSQMGRSLLVGGECHPFALMLGDYLKINKHLKEEPAARSLYAIPGFSACRLGQYPVYVEKIRKELGIPMRVITDLSQSARSAGLPPSIRDMILMRMWEGLNAFDVLISAYYSISPFVIDREEASVAYSQARDAIIVNLAMGRVAQGVGEAMNKLSGIRLRKNKEKRAVIAVTGDYYTRIVPFANNEVFDEIEALGGIILPPPTFTDAVRYYYMKQALFSDSKKSGDDEGASDFYPSAVLAETAIKRAASGYFPFNSKDPFSSKTLRRVSRVYDIRFPAGIAAPVSTTLEQINRPVDGVLNLITLNCAYGGVVTASLSRILSERKGPPMLTLVYDGLKRTNEKTRLEAFMDQARDGVS